SVSSSAPSSNPDSANPDNGNGNPPGAPVGAQDSDRACIGTARILKGNPDTIGRIGGLAGGTTVTPNSAAIIQQQFGVPKSDLRKYGPQVTGTLNGQPLFHGLSDIIGGKSPIPGMNVRDALRIKNRGNLILELPSAPIDMEKQQI